MKKFLLIAISFAFMLSCSTDELSDNLNDKLPSSEMELKLDEYGLFNSEKQFDAYTLGLDPNIIYFNGRYENKLCMESFKTKEKSKLLSWQSKDKYSLEVYEGYGVNTTHVISKFRTITPYQLGEDNIFIIWGIAVGEQYTLHQRIITSDLYFTSGDNSKKLESRTYPEKSYFYSKIQAWFNGSVIVSKRGVIAPSLDSCFCYSVKGEELFKFRDNKNSIPTKNYLAINNTNFIEFRGDARGTLCNINIKDSKKIWESEMPLKDLPEDTRIDNIDFSILNTSDVLCKFNYTLFSGVTGSRKLIVKINTGEIEVQ